MVEKRREIMVGRGGGGICGLMQRRFEVIFRSFVKHVEGRLEKKPFKHSSKQTFQEYRRYSRSS